MAWYFLGYLSRISDGHPYPFQLPRSNLPGCMIDCMTDCMIDCMMVCMTDCMTNGMTDCMTDA